MSERDMKHYFHVIIALKSRPEADVLATDLSEKEMIDNIVKPYLAGSKFACGTELVDPKDIDNIRITATDVPSHELLKMPAGSPEEIYLEAWKALSNANDVTLDYFPRLRQEKAEQKKKQYYHVYIDSMGDETQELDLSKEKLTKYIVRPYRNGRRFLCKGTVVCPSEITTIRIVETEQPSEEILQGRKGLLGLLTDSFSLLESKGKDVTRDFIIIRKRKPKKKALQKKTSPNSQDVFIVHGRDLEPVKQLKTILAGLGLNPIVLHEKPSGSRTIVEKLEKYSDVGYAFVILTPDDRGGFFKGKVPVLGSNLLEDTHFRARQNVILELGYFMGKLGRNKVCCLHTGDVELPSDMHGIVYIPFKKSANEARDMIVKELKAAGYEIVPEQPKKEKEDMEGNKSLRKEVEELKDYLDRRVD